jgi:tripartite-type tricarboxylate transporter receptor subunit TctC
MTGAHRRSAARRCVARPAARALTAAAVAAMALAAGQGTALAADAFPARPVQMIVSVGAGGSTDTIMRALAKFAAPLLGQPLVIVNKAGASGMIGVAEVARAPADGYTIGGTWSGPLTMAPHVSTAQYKPADWTVVAMVTEAPGVLCVKPDFPANNAREFLQELARSPDKYTYGTDGIGGFVHFASERVFASAGVQARMVPFSGADQTITAFLSGTIDIYGGAITSVLPFAKQGKAKCLLVTSAKRYDALPGVDSLGDIGKPELQTLLWRTIVAPAATPPERIARLHEVFQAAAQDPGFRQIARERGEEPWIVDAPTANKYAIDEFGDMAALAKKLKLQQNK